MSFEFSEQWLGAVLHESQAIEVEFIQRRVLYNIEQ